MHLQMKQKAGKLCLGKTGDLQLASKYPQMRVSPLTHARALAVKKAHGIAMDFQMDKAYLEWLERNYPEIISAVTACPGSETPAETESAKPQTRKLRKK